MEFICDALRAGNDKEDIREFVLKKKKKKKVLMGMNLERGLI